MGITGNKTAHLFIVWTVDMTRKFSDITFLTIDESPSLWFPSLRTHLVSEKTDRWLSGRKRSPAKGVYLKRVSRVRIPPDPPVQSRRATNWMRLS